MDEARPVARVRHRTCDACPSQWEGQLEDGRAFYVRYRWGGLEVYISLKPDRTAESAITAGTVFEAAIGHGLDGYLADREMEIHTGHLIDWSGLK